VGRVKRLREKSKQNFSQQEKPMIKKDWRQILNKGLYLWQRSLQSEKF
jgi:hypothetical protein